MPAVPFGNFTGVHSILAPVHCVGIRAVGKIKSDTSSAFPPARVAVPVARVPSNLFTAVVAVVTG